MANIDITENTTISSNIYSFTQGNDKLRILDAEVQFKAPGGTINLLAGNDDVTIGNANITGDNGCYISLSEGDDVLTLNHSTVNVKVDMGEGDDAVSVKQSTVSNLFLGAGNDTLEIYTDFTNLGNLDFGSGDGDALVLDGGSFRNNGTIANLANFEVTQNGGTIYNDVVLSKPNNLITLNGALSGDYVIILDALEGSAIGSSNLVTSKAISYQVGFLINDRVFKHQGSNWSINRHSGVAITLNNSKLELDIGTFNQNTTGISAQDSDIILANVYLTNNYDKGVWASGGTLSFTSGAIRQNSNTNYSTSIFLGGGAGLSGLTTASFSGVSIASNSNNAKYHDVAGGGIAASKVSGITIQGGLFADNVASGTHYNDVQALGGGLYADSSQALEIQSVTFTGNSAIATGKNSANVKGGGALISVLANGTANLSSITMRSNVAKAESENTAGVQGGAIDLSLGRGAHYSLSSAEMHSNIASASGTVGMANGGGLAVLYANDTAVLSNVNMGSNLAEANGSAIGEALGGGIYITATGSQNGLNIASAEMQSNAVKANGNIAMAYGGGIYAKNATSGIMTGAALTFSGNIASASGTNGTAFGGGLYAEKFDLEAPCTTLTKNSAIANGPRETAAGGGVALKSASGNLDNGIIAGNTANADAKHIDVHTPVLNFVNDAYPEEGWAYTSQQRSLWASSSASSLGTALGGGLYTESGRIDATTIKIEGNTARAIASATASANAQALLSSLAIESYSGEMEKSTYGSSPQTQGGNLEMSVATAEYTAWGTTFSTAISYVTASAFALATATAQSLGGGLYAKDENLNLNRASISGNNAIAEAVALGKAEALSSALGNASVYFEWKRAAVTALNYPTATAATSTILRMNDIMGVSASATSYWGEQTAVQSRGHSTSGSSQNIARASKTSSIYGVIAIATGIASGICVVDASATAEAYAYSEAYSIAAGGGLYLTSANSELSDIDFRDNNANASCNGRGASAAAAGGALYAENSVVNVCKSKNSEAISLVVASNSVAAIGSSIAAYGGGFAFVSSTVGIEDAVFADNAVIAQSSGTGVAQGGGIYLAESELELVNVSLTGNVASAMQNASACMAWGGGIFGVNGDIVLNNGTIVNNQAVATGKSYGGAAYFENSTIEMSNVTISGNQAYSSNADVMGGALYVNNSIISLVNVSISDNIASSEGRTYGGALYVIGDSELNYTINADYASDTITLSGNEAAYGGFLYLNSSKATITVDASKELYIENSILTDGKNNKVTFNGGKTVITAEIGGNNVEWIVASGILELSTIARNFSLDNWSVKYGATLALSAENDTLSINADKSVGYGTLAMGAGSDVISINGHKLYLGRLEIGTLTLNGNGGSFEGDIGVLDDNTGMNLTLAAVSFEGSIYGGEQDDRITISGRASSNIVDTISLGGGNNYINVNSSATISGQKLFYVDNSGCTYLTLSRGASIGGNTITVAESAESNLLPITIDLNGIGDYGKYKILIADSRDPANNRFVLEMQNNVSSFTIKVDDHFQVQLQGYRNGAWERILLQDTIAPEKVTGVLIDGIDLSWNAAKDNFGGNGVEKYRIQIAGDASFKSFREIEVEGNALKLVAPNASSYLRICAVDYTGNVGEWSDVALLPPHDNVPQIESLKTVADDLILDWRLATSSDVNLLSHFEVEIARDANFKNVVKRYEVQDVNLIDQFANDDYYVRVRTVDFWGNVSSWCKAESIKIQRLDDPEGLEARVDRDKVYFACEDSQAIAYCELVYSHNEDFTDATVLNLTDVEFLNLTDGVYYWKLRCFDKDGYCSRYVYGGSFIVDTTPPVKPKASVDIPTPTNSNVHVIAQFSDDSLYREYSLDNEHWSAYVNPILMTDNGAVYFRGIDAFGNISDVTCYEVRNIDRIPPKKPVLRTYRSYYDSEFVDPLEAIVYGGFDINEYWVHVYGLESDVVISQYSYDGIGWIDGTSASIIKGLYLESGENLFVRVVDAAGNASESVGGRFELNSRFDYTLEADYTMDGKVSLQVVSQYSTGDKILYCQNYNTLNNNYRTGAAWSVYSNDVVFRENSTYYFMDVAETGLFSPVITFQTFSYEVYHPTHPEITVVTKPNEKYEITVDLKQKNYTTIQYRFGDDGEWLSMPSNYNLQFTTSGVRFYNDYRDITYDEVDTVYYRGITTVGIYSEAQILVHSNNVAPLKPRVTANTTGVTGEPVQISAQYSNISVLNEYSLDKVNWQEYTHAISVVENGTVYFRSIGANGAISDISSCKVNNISYLPKPFASTSDNTSDPVVVYAQFSSMSVQNEYSFDKRFWHAYDSNGVTVTSNGTTVWFRSKTGSGAVSDLASYTVNNIIPFTPDTPDTPDVLDMPNTSVTITYSTSSHNRFYYLNTLYEYDDETIVYHVTCSDNSFPVRFRFGLDDDLREIADDFYVLIDTEFLGEKKIGYSLDEITITTEELSPGNYETFKDLGRFTSIDGDSLTLFAYCIDPETNLESAPSIVLTKDVAPSSPVVSQDIISATGRDVTLTATLRDEDWDAHIEYSFDGKSWSEYGAPIVCNKNCTVYFRTVNEAGIASELVTHTVSNIARPSKPVVTASNTSMTNQNVVLTVVFGNDIVKKEYSTDGEHWIAYTSSVIAVENGTYYFRGINSRNDISEIAIYEITNIDKTAPESPVAFLNITEPTRGNVVVSATFSEDSVKREYSFDKNTWMTYTKNIQMNQNGTLYFRGIDVVGNVSDITQCNITNIDPHYVKIVSLTAEEIEETALSVTLNWNDVFDLPWFTSFDISLNYGESNVILSGIPDCSGIDLYNLQSDLQSWGIKYEQATIWNDCIMWNENASITTNVFVKAIANDLADYIFTRSYFTWGSNFNARHLGNGADWEGTNETAQLAGRNNISDVFWGSSDASILLLSDDANGDALFVDDIYSGFPDELAPQSRISKINEIRAGAGDDLIDLTSQQFKYIGDGMTIRGGLGNDVIWANKGDNWLFGDAGNDRLVGSSGNDIIVGGSGNDSMHGGGGDDIFAFGGDWGKDTVEQLSSGKVTLWFKDGDLSRWNESTLTYTDNENSVKVSGAALKNITLKFGKDGSEQYQSLLAAGAFNEFTSENIFKEKNGGMLA